MTWDIYDLEAEADILSVLERDRGWAAYAICDLEPPHRPHARYIGSVAGGKPDAVVLIYRTPDFATIVPTGDPGGVGAIMGVADNLPATISLSVRASDIGAVETRYATRERWVMYRMVTTRDRVRQAPTVSNADIRPLGPEQAATLADLYAHSAGAVFAPAMLENGYYRGAYVGDRLVAVAGTHAVSERHGIATIGGVYTEPNYRGQGLAQAVSSVVIGALLERGIRDIALNVRRDNEPAIRAYRHLGFQEHTAFWEGESTLR